MEWQETRMTAMKMTINSQGDDLFLNRLFSYLTKQFPFEILSIKPIRRHVFIVETSEDFFVLKGFPSYHRLKRQENFTADLKKIGFEQTYSFLNEVKNPPLYFEQVYYGCMEYIFPSEKPFSFSEQRDRKEGLDLLHQYHLSTSQLAKLYNKRLGRYRIIKKWRERSANFLNNISVIKFFVQKEMIDEILRWADWSLKGLEEELPSIQKGPLVILHGDVAHHNFLRTKSEELYIIDFDLITIGYRSADYLQYANRILPFLDWSLEDLSKIEKMKPFLKEKGFLYALAFPTDILREWNRIIRNRQYEDPVKVRQVLDITVGQFLERQSFMKELRNLGLD